MDKSSTKTSTQRASTSAVERAYRIEITLGGIASGVSSIWGIRSHTLIFSLTTNDNARAISPTLYMFRQLFVRARDQLKRSMQATLELASRALILFIMLFSFSFFLPCIGIFAGYVKQNNKDLKTFCFQNQLPVAMAIVLEERGVKMQHEISRRGINLVYFLFWISTYQFLCVASALVWVFVLPASGNINSTQDASNIEEFGRK